MNNNELSSLPSEETQEATPNNAPTQTSERTRESLLDELTQLREENKQRRLKLSEFEQQQATAQEAQLLEQEKFKELAEKRASTIEALQTKAQKAETYEGMFKSMLERRLENAPEHIKTLLEKLDTVTALEWLDANADQLSPRSAPNLNAGQAGVKDRPYQLTEEQEKYVTKMNLDRDRYIENLKRENER